MDNGSPAAAPKRIGFPLIVTGLVVVIILSVTLAPKRPGWDHKAVADAKVATTIAALSERERNLYKRALSRINPKRLGQLTIAEVVRQEDSRESARAQKLADAEAARAGNASGQTSDASDAKIIKGEFADVKSVLRLSETLTPSLRGLIKSLSIDDSRLTLTADGDVWDLMSSQDRELYEKMMGEAWAFSYNQRHGTKGESASLTIENLAGTEIGSYS